MGAPHGAGGRRTGDRAVDVVDLSRPEAEAAEHVRQSCTSSGFFYVINHDVDEQLISRLFAQIKKFFTLPNAEKARILADDNNRGWTPMAEETLDPANQSQGDTKEGLYFGREASDAEAHLPLHGKNQWPSPELLPEFRPVVSQYFEAARAVSMRLLRLVALALDLDSEFFLPYFDRAMLVLRPLHYSAAPSQPDQGIYGAGAHTDYGILTLLKTDSTPGLQICLHGEWVDVQPMEGAFIVNLGDMLERWTNGRFRSTPHRVVNKAGLERYSVPFFLDPNFNAEVACLPTCCGKDNPPLFSPITAGAHVLAKYAATHTLYDVSRKSLRAA